MEARISRTLETALYVDDLDRALTFFETVLGLRSMVDARPRMVALDAGQGTVLLLFRRGATALPVETPHGVIPPHDSSGPAHAAFAVEPGSLAAWETRLTSRGVAIESRVRWAGGGESVYFRDPDGHSLELVTPGTWENY